MRRALQRLIVVGSSEHRFAIAEQLHGHRARRPADHPGAGRPKHRACGRSCSTGGRRGDPDALRAAHAGGSPHCRSGCLPARRRAGACCGGRWPHRAVRHRARIAGDRLRLYRVRRGAAGHDGVNTVARFHEKPDAATAKAYLASGRHWWNSGIFLVAARVLLSEMEAFAPEVVRCARSALDGAVRDLDFCRLDPDSFARAPSISLDHAVMERTERPPSSRRLRLERYRGMVRAVEAGNRDGDGNVCRVTSRTMNTRNSYVRSEGPLVATLGIEDMIVIATADAVLVARKGADQEVKELVAGLQADNHPGRRLKPAGPPPLGAFPDHRTRRALSGQAHHGEARRQAVAPEALSQGRALGRRQWHSDASPAMARRCC
jgi:hypothetical protein